MQLHSARQLLGIACLGAAGLSTAIPAAARPPVATPIATLPFELNSNKIYLEAQVGEHHGWFILDSGAPRTFLDRDFATNLGLAAENEQTQNLGLGSKPATHAEAHAVAVRLGELQLPAQDVGLLPLDAVLRRYEGRPVAGLLGNDVISRYVVQVDYDQSRVRLYEPTSFRYQGPGKSVPVTFDTHAFVKADVTPPGQRPIPGTFMLDIGVRNALMLFAPFVKAHGLLPDSSRVLFATVGCGIGGEVRSYVARLDRVAIGGLALADPVVTLSTDRSGLQASSEFDGILGAEILKRFNLYLDFSHQRIILEPGRDFRTPFEFDRSGMFLTADSTDLRTMRVTRVIAGSPAAEAGIGEGDEILSVDGRPAAEVGLEGLRRWFVERNAPIVMSVRHGARVLRVEITPRRLV